MDNNITFLEARMKEIVTHSEKEGQATKEYHVACEPEEQLKQKAEFSKTQISTPDLPKSEIT